MFTFTGGRGHLDPLVPVARAAAAAGHTVAFTGAPGSMAAVEARGFRAFATFPPSPDDRPRRVPLRAVSQAREEQVLRDVFAGGLARKRLGGVLELCASWEPDVLVCDEADFGAMLAAERLGLPHATVLVTATGSFLRPALLAPPLDALRAEHDLPPDPGLAMLARHLVISPFPPGLRDPAFPLPDGAVALRPAALEEHDDTVPGWLERLGARPVVHFTLGTVFNLEAGDLFTRVLAGLAQLEIDVIVAVGDAIEPAELGPQPDHVRIERHVEHAVLLPRCSAVVSHGGSGTVVGALAHGLPSVLIPMGADQPLNAARCAELGVARVLDAVHATPADVRDATTAVLREPAYRAAAQRMRDEIAALPGPEHAVGPLERLAS